MNIALTEINVLYLSIEHLFDPSSNFILSLDHLSNDDLETYRRAKKELTRVYESAMYQVQQVLPLLSSDEIIEGYKEGSRLLQRNISGYMGKYFDDSYIDVMINAIQSNHVHTSWMFLHILADKVGKPLSYIYIQALDSESDEVREAALSVLEQLNVVEAMPSIETLTYDPIATISALAKDILLNLRNRFTPE